MSALASKTQVCQDHEKFVTKCVPHTKEVGITGHLLPKLRRALSIKMKKYDRITPVSHDTLSSFCSVCNVPCVRAIALLFNQPNP